jgi:hypothetical protein
MRHANPAPAGLNWIGAPGGGALVFGFVTLDLGYRQRIVNWPQPMVFQVNLMGSALVWRSVI